MEEMEAEAMMALISTNNQADPQTGEEAEANPNANEWLLAEEENLRAIRDLNVYKLINRPKNGPVLPTTMDKAQTFWDKSPTRALLGKSGGF